MQNLLQLKKAQDLDMCKVNPSALGQRKKLDKYFTGIQG